ncbi:heat shock protein [Trypanosoma grayi]|uniref:heat shock protein n=1 Tax=Trypanosoma grayi TaxID=71804 RepID=UPI0004F41C4F|nr:heat shock protein [Trypanosoma grayi]KEG07329.1 heat shock protein [Trypanosoma grayi]
MPQRTCSGSLYNLLGVSSDATQQEIKKAYHQLALRLHPDKTGGDTTEEFKLIQGAQAVLTDPQQRRVYDTFGKKGMDALSQFGDAGMFLDPSILRVTFLLLALWSALFLLTFELVIVRLDYNKTWPWAAVFGPCWVALLPVLLFGGVLQFRGIAKRDFASFLLGCGFMMVIAAVTMFVAGLSDAVPWTAALAPSAALYVVESFFVMRYLIPSNFRELCRESVDAGVPVCRMREYWDFALGMIFEKACVFVFLALALLRAGQTGKESSELFSFWAIFAPLIIYFGFMTLRSVSACIIARVDRAIVAVMFYGGLLYMTCMMAAKCSVEHNHVVKGLHPSAAVTLLPLQVVLILNVLVPCCTSCFAEGVLETFCAGGSTSGENASLSNDERPNRGEFTGIG